MSTGETSPRRRGRPKGSGADPLAKIVDAMIENLRAELEKRGAHAKAEDLLNPGTEGAPGTSGKPSGLSTIEGIIRFLRDDQGVPEDVISNDDIRRAINSRKREERRKKSKNAS